jgi:hypothetical protein
MEGKIPRKEGYQGRKDIKDIKEGREDTKEGRIPRKEGYQGRKDMKEKRQEDRQAMNAGRKEGRTEGAI